MATARIEPAPSRLQVVRAATMRYMDIQFVVTYHNHELALNMPLKDVFPFRQTTSQVNPQCLHWPKPPLWRPSQTTHKAPDLIWLWIVLRLSVAVLTDYFQHDVPKHTWMIKCTTSSDRIIHVIQNAAFQHENIDIIEILPAQCFKNLQLLHERIFPNDSKNS